MQVDMHFYGTYAMALTAGIPEDDAHTIAYAAQFVDDSTKQDSKPHPDGGLLYGIATAHNDRQCVENAHKDLEEQRRVWVPFHFLPGGTGENLEQKLICVQDSAIAKEMINNHIGIALTKKYGLELMGIGAHVYMDTFSHYGFSGISSSYNSIIDESITPINVQNPTMKRYILDKKGTFFQKYGLNNVISFIVEKLTHCLGHGAVATFPDRPFLEWRFEFDRARPSGEKESHRNNRTTFLDGCEKLHACFCKYAKQKYTDNTSRPFAEIQPAVERIIAFEGTHSERSNQWIKEGLIPEDTHYDPELWENDKVNFHKFESSTDITDKSVYRFHQAAAYHRYFVLKDLLPSHGIVVY